MEYNKVKHLMNRIKQHIKDIGVDPLPEVYEDCIVTILLRED